MSLHSSECQSSSYHVEQRLYGLRNLAAAATFDGGCHLDIIMIKHRRNISRPGLESESLRFRPLKQTNRYQAISFRSCLFFYAVEVFHQLETSVAVMHRGFVVHSIVNKNMQINSPELTGARYVCGATGAVTRCGRS